MRRFLFGGGAFLLAVSLLVVQGLAQEKSTTDVSIRAHVFQPAMVPPTVERIKGLKLPAGFHVAKFAEISNPRILSVAGNGTVYVSQRDPGTITMLRDTNGDGAADVQMVVAEKEQMHGVYVDGNQIYLVTVKEVFKADIRPDGTLGELRMIIDDLPDGGQHPNRTLAVRDGKIFISVGSTCNACDETTPEAATMLVTDLDGKGRRIFASGLRNTVGFGWHPVSKKFYGMDHGIDWLGDDDQHEELNELIDGAKYGWPYVYDDSKLVPHRKPPAPLGLTNQDWAAQSKEPVLMYTPHAAPMQMAFYTGTQFPAEYRNDAFVSFRGSWNRSRPSGYEIVRIRFNDRGAPTAFEPFLTGFIVKGGAPDGKDATFARPVGMAQLPDGSLLFTDDTNNLIYRITYGSDAMPPIMSRENISMLLPETAGAAAIKVTSPAFTNMGALADKYSAYFQDVSPQLQWSGVPKDARSLVLMMEDPDAAIKPVTHWLVANIPVSVNGFPENVPKTQKYGQAVQGGNFTGKLGYFGPKPPPADGPHKYHFQIFALDKMLDLPAGFNRQALLNAMKGHVVGQGEIVGTYQRKPDVRDKP
jgi:Raf kinase inhibitor-like YbhB/YbcL family protein